MTVPAPFDELAPLPPVGRRYDATRTVRLGDVGIDGALRLDAVARFLQDVAADDAADAGLRGASWVVRRTVLVVEGRPTFGERIALTTFCGGIGSRWAERRTTVTGPDSRIEASSLWVYLEEATGRPAPLPPRFLEAYAEASMGRSASSRLTLPGPPAEAPGDPWPLRPTDFDVLGHVNNAVYWTVVEEAPRPRGRFVLEYRTPIEPGAAVRLVRGGEGPAGGRWLVSDRGVHAAFSCFPAANG